jgi:dTDP-4-amino-4,6-dideoxygalactose transaminase
LIPRFRPTLFFSDLQILFQSRPRIEDFENMFAEFTGWRHGILFPYGHAAAYSFYMANGVMGRDVIMPAYNCRVMLSAVIGSHNRPIFVDCEENGVNMDDRKAISRIHENTGVICPTAMYGYPFNIELYQDVSDRVLILADLAHKLFEDDMNVNRYKGIHAAIYSLGIGKQVTMLGGGMLCTNDSDIFLKIKKYRDNKFRMNPTGLYKVLFKFIASCILFSPMFYRLLYFLTEKTRFFDSLVGYDIGVVKILPDDFFKMPVAFQVGLGLRQLGRIGIVKERRRAVIRRYDSAFRNRELKRINVLRRNPDCSHYPILTDDRDELSAYLSSEGIHAVNIFNQPVYELPIAKDFKDKDGYPRADSITKRCLLLPLYDLMTESEQNHVITSLLLWDDKG